MVEKEIVDRLAKVEEQLAAQKNDLWKKITIITPILIPLVVAFIGWYFTNVHNKNELEIQKINNSNQVKVANINSNVGQSSLIKDFMPHLMNKDTAVRNIAMEAILYAAPSPGKKIVEIIAKSSDSKTRASANDALESKRDDLVNSLFAKQKQRRLSAATEITSNWNSDEQLLSKLISRANECLDGRNTAGDCKNGIYNAMVILPSFAPELLSFYKQELKKLQTKIPTEYTKTADHAQDLIDEVIVK